MAYGEKSHKDLGRNKEYAIAAIHKSSCNSLTKISYNFDKQNTMKQ